MDYLKNIYYLYATMDKNNKYLLYMICLIIFLLILIIIISLISKKKENKRLLMIQEQRKEYKKNFRKNVKPLNFSDLDEEDEIKPNLSINQNIKPKKIKESNIKSEVKEEIEILESEINKEKPKEIEIEVIESDVDSEIENIKNQIQENIDNPNTIKLNEFEEEQEKSAIISYDELVKKAGAKKIIYKKQKEETKPSSFRPSEVVSPIYGVQNKKIQEIDREIDSFSRIEKLKVKDEVDEEKNDLEFLNKLKKFRSELN